jgi:hypothetical protein
MKTRWLLVPLAMMLLTGCSAPSPALRVEAPDACAPPPARAFPLVPSFCGGARGYYWDGAACRATGLAEDRCACDLTRECTLFETVDACEVAHASCR